MTDIKKIQAQRLGNPIPESERIFLCNTCHNHRYFRDRYEKDVCNFCQKKLEQEDDGA